MATTRIVGGGQAGQPQIIGGENEIAVDPLYLAPRIALRPLDYTGAGALLGHYAVAQKSGNLVSIGALGHLAKLRWAPASNANNTFCVLMRIKIGWTTQSAITAAVQMDFDASIARGFTVDYTTACTMANMTGVPRTNAMRSGGGLPAMQSSQMGTSGPGIATTVVCSGQTLTLDSNPFAMQVFDAVPAVNGTLNVPVGRGSAGMVTMYEWTALGQHPVVLSNNEGVVIREVTAGPTTGGYNLYVQWEWAEVSVF